MLTDFYLRVAVAQDVTGTSAVSDDSVDLMTAGREIGTGYNLEAVVTVTTTFAGPTAVAFEVISASDEALTTGIALYGSSGFCPIANVVAPANASALGTRVVVRLNEQPIAVYDQVDGDASATSMQSVQRYLGVRVISAGDGAAITAGAFTADFVLCPSHTTNKHYASGFTF